MDEVRIFRMTGPTCVHYVSGKIGSVCGKEAVALVTDYEGALKPLCADHWPQYAAGRLGLPRDSKEPDVS